jgi:hypothetical protein
MDLEHGSNVRSPSLIGGNSYIMKTWSTKEHAFSEVTFLGFLSGTVEYKSPNKQLKDMTPTDFYLFVDSKSKDKFRGKMSDNCLVHETSESRVTFFDLTGVVSTKAPKAVSKKAAKNTPPAPPVKTPEELKREAANEKKRAKRAADKLAKEEAAKAASGDNTLVEDVAEGVTEGEVEHVAEEEVIASEEEVFEHTEGEDDGFGTMPALTE